MIFTDDLDYDERMMRIVRRKRSEEENAHWFAPLSSQLDCQVVQVGLQFPTRKDVV